MLLQFWIKWNTCIICVVCISSHISRNTQEMGPSITVFLKASLTSQIVSITISAYSLNNEQFELVLFALNYICTKLSSNVCSMTLPDLPHFPFVVTRRRGTPSITAKGSFLLHFFPSCFALMYTVLSYIIIVFWIKIHY